ncbi:MAG: protoporphyrinogen oxidase [Nitrospira sp.]|nr:protoporphyrinogen oxidase [Nitrospira sp.]
MMAIPKRVVIVGGGISGLSAAFALLERASGRNAPFRCTVVEGQDYLGGKILTNRRDGVITEGAPDSFLTTKPEALALCEKLGLSSQLIDTNQENAQTFIYSKGRLRQFPQGLISMVPTKIGPLFHSGVLSWAGIVRMGADWVIPCRARAKDEETLAEFFSRRLGGEAFDRLIEPLVAGIYAGDANELSADATFPHLVELERKYGSLIKGALATQQSRSSHQPGAKPRTLFTTLRGGLGDLITSLTERLSGAGVSLRRGTSVRAVHIPGSQTEPPYRLELEGGGVLDAEAVILATPAYVSANLLRPFDDEASTLLDQIPYASTMTISMVFPEPEVKGLIRGYGFVVPRVENRSLIAATWSSMKWAERAPAGQCLVRCYLGRRGREDLLDSNDSELTERACRELEAIVGIQSRPLHVEAYRWPRSMPQYIRGHCERVRHIRERVARRPGLYVTGAAYDGIGIPDCIRDAEQTSAKLSAYLWDRASV